MWIAYSLKVGDGCARSAHYGTSFDAKHNELLEMEVERWTPIVVVFTKMLTTQSGISE